MEVTGTIMYHPLRPGKNISLGVDIDEEWTTWGRCYSIKSHNASPDESLVLYMNHSLAPKIGQLYMYIVCDGMFHLFPRHVSD